jgi:branched-chain amino acid transport system substrate-binding protein
MKTRHLLGLVFLTLITAIVPIPGCGNKAVNQDKTFRFGAVLPITGDGAALGALERRGLELGLQDVNSNKDGIRLEMVLEDSRTKPDQGLTAFRKVVDLDNATVVVVGFSAICNAVAPVAEDSSALMIGTTTSMPGLVDGRRRVIRLFPNADTLAAPIVSYAASRFSRVAVIFAEDEYGRTIFKAFRDQFEKDGRRVIFSDSFLPSDTEFRSSVAKMLNTNPDAIYLPGYGPGYIALINQIRERNAQIPIMADSPLSNPPVYKAAGNAVEGVVIPATPLDAGIAETPEQKAFLESYQHQFSENPSINVTITYDLVHLLYNAVQNTDRSPEQIRNYFISQNPYVGLVGEIRYEPSGESIIPVRAMMIKGGTIVSQLESEKPKALPAVANK